MISLVRNYPAPFRIVSDNPDDTDVLAALAPGKREILAHAGGVALDLRPYVAGKLTVLDATGATVPLADWLLPVRDARGGGRALD